MSKAQAQFTEGTILVTTQKFRFYVKMDRYQCGEGETVPVPEGTAVVVFKFHGRQGLERLLVHTIENPKLWAWVWSEVLEAPLQEQES